MFYSDKHTKIFSAYLGAGIGLYCVSYNTRTNLVDPVYQYYYGHNSYNNFQGGFNILIGLEINVFSNLRIGARFTFTRLDNKPIPYIDNLIFKLSDFTFIIFI